MSLRQHPGALVPAQALRGRPHSFSIDPDCPLLPSPYVRRRAESPHLNIPRAGRKAAPSRSRFRLERQSGLFDRARAPVPPLHSQVALGLGPWIRLEGPREPRVPSALPETLSFSIALGARTPLD